MARRQGHPIDDPLLNLQRWQQLWTESTRAISKPVKTDAAIPYLGLKPYQRDDFRLFFGRRRATHELAALVQEIAQSEEPHGLVVLVGASGAGKSSLLEAGLIPTLTNSENEWAIATLNPGSTPMASLRATVEAVTAELVKPRVSSTPPLHQDPIIAGLNGWANDRQRLMIVDQFEELFTACEDDHERDAFLATLERAAARRPDYASIVIIAVRADFYARCLDYPVLASALSKRSYVLDSMRLDELREVITAPAELSGLVLEPGLQELVITELCGTGAQRSGSVASSDTLPLLSHVMEAIWQKREGRRLTVAGYRESGGVVGSVATTAERAWNGLTESQQEVAKQILLSLVTIGHNSRDTRRTASRSELLHTVGNINSAETALETLTVARLITIDGDAVYLTHEIVLDAWPRLRRWIDEDRAGYLVRQQLEEDAAQWVAAGRDDSLLYRGARLESAQTHFATPPVSTATREFLEASNAERRKAQRRAFFTKTILATLGVIVLVMTAGFFDKSQTAERQRADAIFQEVLAKADSLQDIDPSVSAQLYLVAYRLRPNDPDVAARLLGTQTMALATPLAGPDSPVLGIAFSPRGFLASTYGDGSVRLWDTKDPSHPHQMGIPITGIKGFVSAAGFSPDGNLLAIGGEDHAVRLFDVQDPLKPRLLADPLIGGNGAVYNATFSPDGRTLAASNDDHTVALWNVVDPSKPVLIGRIDNQAGAIRSIAFSPNGRFLATANDDRTVRLWSVADPAVPTPIGSPLGGFSTVVHAVAFSSDSLKLAAGDDDGIVQVWDLTNSAAPRPANATLPAHTGKIWSLAFGPGGQTLITGGTEGTAKLWNLEGLHPRMIGRPLTGRHGGVFGVAISPNQRIVATGNQDGVVRLWSLPGDAISSHGAIDNMALDPKSRILATNTDAGKIQIWDTRDPHTPHRLGELVTNTQVRNLAISPGGRTLAVLNRVPSEFLLYDISNPGEPRLFTKVPLRNSFEPNAVFNPSSSILVASSDEHSVQVWNIADPKSPTPLGVPVHVSSGWVTSMRYNRDGTLLVTADSLGTVKLWDLSNPAQPRQIGRALSASAASIYSVALSPDGRTLVSAGDDKTARIWDISRPTEPVPVGDPLTGYSSAVNSMDFSPGGNLLATGSYNGDVRLWNFSNRDHPTPITLSTVPSTAPKRSVAFNSTDEYLVVSGHDEGLLIWDMGIDHAVRRICNVTQNIDSTLWAQVLPGLAYKPPCN
ncbi:NACHT and WD repeat domain-containing protein [Nocardia transvalensis]|uniref:NACHT and WD repeat domain-containing protein n=1 Tax=Nocardia transvalensis TaxID=37333 RepID=UPI001892E3B4|nr:hypothetical protein [Nocardia transvalensis]MBF6331832.1 hypothetical protein [Nocardia transvalensis]